MKWALGLLIVFAVSCLVSAQTGLTGHDEHQNIVSILDSLMAKLGTNYDDQKAVTANVIAQRQVNVDAANAESNRLSALATQAAQAATTTANNAKTDNQKSAVALDTLKVETDNQLILLKTLKRLVLGQNEANSCKEAKTLDPTAKTGWTTLKNGNKVFCDQDFQGGGWTLVRRAVNSWADNRGDNLAGTQAWGTPVEPTARAAFSIVFNTLPFAEMLFSTGNQRRWLISGREDVYGGWKNGGCDAIVTIRKSYQSNTPYQVGWCKRHGASEDPWISAQTHNFAGRHAWGNNDDTHSMLYGENMGGVWLFYLQNDNGANVWVR